MDSKPSGIATARIQPLRIENCRRINITGNAGSGKTTTALWLGKQLGLSVYSLDTIVWQSGWKKTPMHERLPLEQELISQSSWIIDGVSERVRSAADLVLFLDVPVRTCLLRATLRTMRHLFKQRPEFPEGCLEWRIYPRLVRIIRQFQRNAGSDIQTEAEQDVRYLTVSSLRELTTRFRVPPDLSDEYDFA